MENNEDVPCHLFSRDDDSSSSFLFAHIVARPIKLFDQELWRLDLKCTVLISIPTSTSQCSVPTTNIRKRSDR